MRRDRQSRPAAGASSRRVRWLSRGALGRSSCREQCAIGVLRVVVEAQTSKPSSQRRGESFGRRAGGLELSGRICAPAEPQQRLSLGAVATNRQGADEVPADAISQMPAQKSAARSSWVGGRRLQQAAGPSLLVSVSVRVGRWCLWKRNIGGGREAVESKYGCGIKVVVVGRGRESGMVLACREVRLEGGRGWGWSSRRAHRRWSAQRWCG